MEPRGSEQYVLCYFNLYLTSTHVLASPTPGVNVTEQGLESLEIDTENNEQYAIESLDTAPQRC